MIKCLNEQIIDPSNDKPYDCLGYIVKGTETEKKYVYILDNPGKNNEISNEKLFLKKNINLDGKIKKI